MLLLSDCAFQYRPHLAGDFKHHQGICGWKSHQSEVPFTAVSRRFSLRRSGLRAPGALRLSPAEQNQYGCLLPPQFQQLSGSVCSKTLLKSEGKTLWFSFFYLSAVSFFAGGELLFFESLDSRLEMKHLICFQR